MKVVVKINDDLTVATGQIAAVTRRREGDWWHVFVVTIEGREISVQSWSPFEGTQSDLRVKANAEVDRVTHLLWPGEHEPGDGDIKGDARCPERRHNVRCRLSVGHRPDHVFKDD